MSERENQYNFEEEERPDLDPEYVFRSEN